MVQTVYLNQEQCEKFDVDYYYGTELVVQADKLLFSKPGGYDDFHHNMLRSHGDSKLVLIRDPAVHLPGWFNVSRTI